MLTGRSQALCIYPNGLNVNSFVHRFMFMGWVSARLVDQTFSSYTALVDYLWAQPILHGKGG